MGRMVNVSQHAFMEGKEILDAILVTNEVDDLVHKNVMKGLQTRYGEVL